MRDGFFLQLQEQIAEERLSANARETFLAQNRGFAADAIKQLHPVVMEFDVALQALGYRSNVHGGPERIEHRLTWADQHYATITFHADPDTGELLTTKSRSVMYEPVQVNARANRRDWDLAEAILTLENFIQDFADEAAEHDGIN